MNIDARKQEILNNLYMLENECKFFARHNPKSYRGIIKG